MKTKNRISFKSQPVGTWDSYKNVDIRINLKECGVLHVEKDSVAIRFQVIKKDIMEDGNKNCVWKWITLKNKPTNKDDAKTFLKENVDKIVESFNLFYGE